MTKKINDTVKWCKCIKFCTQDNRRGRSAKRGLADEIIIMISPQKKFIWWELKTKATKDKPSDEQEKAMAYMKIIAEENPCIEADYIDEDNIDEKLEKLIMGKL